MIFALKSFRFKHKFQRCTFGGYRNSVEAEFWIMPKKGEFPQPTPEQREIANPENEPNK